MTIEGKALAQSDEMSNQEKAPAKEKKIAILGWGSLIWDTAANQEFDLLHGEWMLDGPVLRLEFSRKSTSRAGALTLVIDAKHGAPCMVAYTLSKRPTLAAAIEDLRRREGTSAAKIGRLLTNESEPDGPESDAALGGISAWAERKEIDAVIWTALRGHFDAASKEEFVRVAVKYVQDLNAEGTAKAAEYFSRAPAFVRTSLRNALQKEPWFRAIPAPGNNA